MTTDPDHYPTRFSWPMRLFLSAILFTMTFRAFSVMYPWGDWADELGADTKPAVRLPTRSEMERLRAAQEPDEPDAVREEVMRAVDSVWAFYAPWPEAAARRRMKTWADAGKWGLVWVNSRVAFVEGAIGFDEEWPMFSPNVGKRRRIARARLVFEDGTTLIVRNPGDPEDLTRYAHWNKEKVLDYSLKVREGRGKWAESKGWCNFLASQHPANESGSPLKTIRLFLVVYDAVPAGKVRLFPGEGESYYEPSPDAEAWLRRQNGPPESQVYPDFYEYDVKTKDGNVLIDTYDRAP